MKLKEWKLANLEKVRGYRAKEKAKYSKNSLAIAARRKIKRAAMTSEQRTAQYLKYKHHNTPLLMQASGQQDRIKRKYPLLFAASDIPGTRALESWIKVHWHRPCKYCGAPSNSIDHLVPVSRGGLHVWANLQLICSICNTAKDDLLEEEFLVWVRRLQALL